MCAQGRDECVGTDLVTGELTVGELSAVKAGAVAVNAGVGRAGHRDPPVSLCADCARAGNVFRILFQFRENE
jgi:hypothetical protein